MTAKKKILIIDDEPGFTSMVKLNLETTGRYEVMIENDSQQAVATAAAYQPDLILLDIIMPVEGPDVLCQLRKSEALQDVPVVFLTATVRREEVAHENGHIGGHPFLAKPGTVDELITCIDEELG